MQFPDTPFCPVSADEVRHDAESTAVPQLTDSDSDYQLMADTGLLDELPLLTEEEVAAEQAAYAAYQAEQRAENDRLLKLVMAQQDRTWSKLNKLRNK